MLSRDSLSNQLEVLANQVASIKITLQRHQEADEYPHPVVNTSVMALGHVENELMALWSIVKPGTDSLPTTD